MASASLQTLVERSYLLNDAQRRYWLTQLPRMDEAQCGKLEKILAGTDQMPFQKELERYLLSLSQATAKLYSMPV